MSNIPLEEQFRYHPPRTEIRKAKHESVNKAALDFAKAIDESVGDREYKNQAIQWVQTARMIANQAITFEEVEREKG